MPNKKDTANLDWKFQTECPLCSRKAGWTGEVETNNGNMGLVMLCPHCKNEFSLYSGKIQADYNSQAPDFVAGRKKQATVVVLPFPVKPNYFFNQNLQLRDKAAANEILAMPFDNAGQIISIWRERINGELIIWQTQDASAAYVNSRFFSNLVVVDVTQLETSVTIGQVKNELFRYWNEKKIIEILIHAGIVCTLIHTHAELTPDTPINTTERFLQKYQATHYFYTNVENKRSYRFTIEISKETGSIIIQAFKGA